MGVSRLQVPLGESGKGPEGLLPSAQLTGSPREWEAAALCSFIACVVHSYLQYGMAADG